MSQIRSLAADSCYAMKSKVNKKTSPQSQTHDLADTNLHRLQFHVIADRTAQ